jgi:hypothetical protein
LHKIKYKYKLAKKRSKNTSPINFACIKTPSTIIDISWAKTYELKKSKLIGLS